MDTVLTADGVWDRELAWRWVLLHLPHLRKTMQAIARRWPAMCADDLLNDLVVDLVERFELYDPARGSFKTWAHTRARLTTLRHQRKLKYARQEAAAQIGESQEVDDGRVDPALPVGAYGTAGRCEAMLDVVHAYTLAQPAEQSVWLRELYGLRRRKDDSAVVELPLEVACAT